MAELGIASHADRYGLLLEISRIVNAPLELPDVTDAVAKALQPLAAIDSLVLITVEGDQVVTRSIHISGVPRQEGDTVHDLVARGFNLSPEEVSRRIPIVKPLAGSSLEYAARQGRPYVMNDLVESGPVFEFDKKLIEFGIRACVLCPVTVRDSLVGALAFSRRTPNPFTDEEVTLMGDISVIVGTALANSLAYEQIRMLKDQLQAENVLLRQQIAETDESDEMIGRSASIRRVQEAVERVSTTDATVLICGETGTGKELVARAIHRRSSRGKKSLVKINCAALPEALIASELFGHERGAFTGATQRRIGRFEMASGSSLFLDEVGEIPLDVQVALLRVMQEREFERLGGTQTIHADVRLIAATNRNLQESIAEGSFRERSVLPVERVSYRGAARSEAAGGHSAFGGRIRRAISQRMGDGSRGGSGADGPVLQLRVAREYSRAAERGRARGNPVGWRVVRVDPQALMQTAEAEAAAAGNGKNNICGTRSARSWKSALAQSNGRVSGPAVRLCGFGCQRRHWSRRFARWGSTSIDLGRKRLFQRRALGVNSSAPFSVMCISSSRRMPNSPGM